MADPVRISEIARRRPDSTRHVGIRFDERTQAMLAAVHLWRDYGIDVYIENATIWVDTPRPFALPTQQILERATGTMGFSDWDAA